MSKKRLEEIRNRMIVEKHYFKYLNSEKGYWENVYTLLEQDMNYLFNTIIEQAERVNELEKQNKRYRELINQIKNNIPSEFNHRSEYEAKKNVIRLINIDNLVNEYLEGEE